MKDTCSLQRHAVEWGPAEIRRTVLPRRRLGGQEAARSQRLESLLRNLRRAARVRGVVGVFLFPFVSLFFFFLIFFFRWFVCSASSWLVGFFSLSLLVFCCLAGATTSDGLEEKIAEDGSSVHPSLTGSKGRWITFRRFWPGPSKTRTPPSREPRKNGRENSRLRYGAAYGSLSGARWHGAARAAQGGHWSACDAL